MPALASTSRGRRAAQEMTVLSRDSSMNRPLSVAGGQDGRQRRASRASARRHPVHMRAASTLVMKSLTGFSTKDSRPGGRAMLPKNGDVLERDPDKLQHHD